MGEDGRCGPWWQALHPEHHPQADEWAEGHQWSCRPQMVQAECCTQINGSRLHRTDSRSSPGRPESQQETDGTWRMHCVDVPSGEANGIFQSNFNHILRLLNTNVDGKQKVVYSLT